MSDSLPYWVGPPWAAGANADGIILLQKWQVTFSHFLLLLFFFFLAFSRDGGSQGHFVTKIFRCILMAFWKC